jgi:hypothetical protein
MGLSGCGVVARAVREESTGLAAPGPTTAERAKIAWQYFQTGRNSATGLVETSAGGGFTTTATIGDQIAAAICALRLGAAQEREFDAMISQILVFLNGAPLAGGQLPGRFYNNGTGRLVDPPADERDPGWSGVQLGRLLIWLRALANLYPRYAYAIAGIVDRWQVCVALDGGGRILEGLPSPSGIDVRPDVSSGYGVYAAQGFRAWGLPAADLLPVLQDYSIAVEGIDFPIGSASVPVPPLHVMPYALLGLELGWQSPTGGSLSQHRRMAERLFEAQDRRRRRTGVITARAEFRRSAAPYALNGTVLASGSPWATLGEDGASHPELALIATKAAFAMWALGAPSAKQAFAASNTLFDANTGWLEGRYEASAGYEWTRSAATNAIVLEALLHREIGRIVPLTAGTPLTPGGAIGFSCTAPA